MPVTIYPAQGITPRPILTEGHAFRTVRQVLEDLPLKGRSEAGEIFQSSFVSNDETNPCRPDGPDCVTKLHETPVLRASQGNGFVDAALRAYNEHHHLVLRPDNVWIAILSQFSYFVNNHAEELRHSFVAHKGKKELKISSSGSRYTVDFGSFAQQFTGMMHDNLVDKTLAEWILPEFTTTTANDRVCFSIAMMATLKEYFDFKIFLLCGLPAVTLLGERQDWVTLLNRIEKLKEYGKETTEWYTLLKPVLSRFVETFDQPNSESVKDFWNRIAHVESLGSGTPRLSGWITAFCFFDNEGRVQPMLDDEEGDEETSPLTLDQVKYPTISTRDIPAAFAAVPVYLNDNGVEFYTTMVSGSVAMKAMTSDAFGTESSKELMAIQPVSGWVIYENIGKSEEDNN